MAHYPDLNDMDELWPEEGYAIISEDELKPPDSDDFVTMLQQFSDSEFALPPSREGYSYWVHDADGNRYSRSEWQTYREEQQ
jgi:hypothetical protein